MVSATKPGGWVVVTDTDWIQFDAQAIPEPFATLSSTLRAHAVQQHGYDGDWGRRLIPAFQAAGLVDVDAVGPQPGRCTAAPTRPSGTSARSARALPILPREIFPEGLDPEAAVAQAREPGLRHPLADVGHLRGAQAVSEPPSSSAPSPPPRPPPVGSCSTPPGHRRPRRATTASPSATWPRGPASRRRPPTSTSRRRTTCSSTSWSTWSPPPRARWPSTPSTAHDARRPGRGHPPAGGRPGGTGA